MKKWIAFANDFPTDPKASFGVLKELNEELITVSVLLGNGLKPSEADIIVFSAIHSSVVWISKTWALFLGGYFKIFCCF